MNSSFQSDENQDNLLVSENIENNLKIIAINVNSLISVNKQYITQNFLDTEKPDIVLVSETKLNPTHYVNFQNYNFLRSDRPLATQGGGTALLYKKCLNLKQIKRDFFYNFKLIEVTVAKLNLVNNRSLFLISLFATNSNRNLFINEIDTLFNKLKLNNSKNYYIISGDFNARNTLWGDTVDSQRAKYLNRWYQKNGVEQKCALYTPESPTYENSFLDHCLADARLKIINNNNKLPVQLYDSDHNALKITAHIPTQFEDNDDPVPPKFLFKKTNGSKFIKVAHKNYKSNVPSDYNISNENIDIYINEINGALLKTIELLK